MATTNKDFRIKNGLIVDGANATVNGNTVLTNASSINALSDVTISSPTSGQVLKWNGSTWVNDTDATGGGGGTASNSFETISANGTSVIADSATDTLTITPGDGISIDGNATSDTITFTPNVASATANGIINTNSQTFAGIKTFNSNIIANANVNVATGHVFADAFRVDTTYTTASSTPGEMVWNDTDGTIEFQLKGGNVTLQLGQEQVLRVRNNTASNITNGTVVYIKDSNGSHFNVEPALASADPTSAQTLGVMTETITTTGGTQTGYVTTNGLVRDLDLSYIAGLAAGQILYLDGSTAGRMTNVKPKAPTHLVYVGYCLSTSNGNNSTIFVKPQNGYELDEIHDVLIDTANLATGEILQRTSNNLWENRTLAEADIANLAATGLQTFAGAVTITGNANATTFNGSGAGLTSIPNSATTATDANGASTIVARNASGNFTANRIFANVSASSITANTINNGVGNITISADSITIGNATSGTTTTTFIGSVSSPTLRPTSIDEANNTSTTHAFQIGADAAANLRLDPNEVSAIDNGNPSTLILNQAGGNVTIGAATSTVTIAGIANANIINATNINFTSAALGTTGTQNLDFATDAYKTMANITGTTTFTATNYGIGRTVTVRVINGSTTTARSIVFPASWVFVGPEPTTIAASKTGILTVTSFGTTEADCVAAWAVQV